MQKRKLPDQADKYLIGKYFDGYASFVVVVNGKFKFGFVDEKEFVCLEPEYNLVKRFSDGVAPVFTERDRWFYVDSSGRRIGERSFHFARCFEGEFAKVCVPSATSWEWGVIDRNLRMIVEPRCSTSDDIRILSSGLVIYKPNPYRDGETHDASEEPWHVLGTRTKKVEKFHRVGNIEDGMIAVRVNGKSGYLDEDGNRVIECRFGNAGFFGDGLAPVMIGDKWGYIDKRGQQVIDCVFQKAYPFHGGSAIVTKGEHVTLEEIWTINKAGNLQQCLGNPYKGASDAMWLGSGRFALLEKGCVYLIDSSGRRITETGFGRIEHFRDTYAEVSFTLEGPTVGIIDTLGRTIVPPRFKCVRRREDEELFEVWPDGLATDSPVGYYDYAGDEIISPKYSHLMGLCSGIAYFKNNGKPVCVNNRGKEMWLI